MPGFEIGYIEQGHMFPDVRYYPPESSQTIYAGDVVILVKEASNYNTPRVRKLTQTEITADYTESAVVKGILGIALHDIVTSSAGVPSAITPSTVNADARAIYALPTYASGLPPFVLTEGSEATDKGKSRLAVALFNSWTVFRVRAAAGSDVATTINQSNVGTTAGIQITNTVDFKADISDVAGDDSILTIVGVAETDPTFNTSSILTHVYVKVRTALQQDNLGLVYVTSS